MYDLSFGMYFLYTSCTRELCNRFGRTPNFRDSMVHLPPPKNVSPSGIGTYTQAEERVPALTH